jgi:hypothetical protein
MRDLFGSAPHHSRYFPHEFDFHKMRTVICATGAAGTNTVPALSDRFVTSTRSFGYPGGYPGGLEAVSAPQLYLSAAFAPK